MDKIKLNYLVIRAINQLIEPPNGVIWGIDYDTTIFPEGYEKPSKELFEAKLQELIDTQPWKELREERNRRIAETDYLAIPDYPHPTEEVKQAWLDYRQALRDLPANTTDPENPVWPEAPE